MLWWLVVQRWTLNDVGLHRLRAVDGTDRSENSAATLCCSVCVRMEMYAYTLCVCLCSRKCFPVIAHL